MERGHRVRNSEDRQLDCLAESCLHIIARNPDLINETSGLAPRYRHRLGLPNPHSNVVAAIRHGLARVLMECLEFRRIQADYVDGEPVPQRPGWSSSAQPRSAVYDHLLGTVRDPCRLQG